MAKCTYEIGRWIGGIEGHHFNLKKVVGAVAAVLKASSEEEKINLLNRQDQDGSASCWRKYLLWMSNIVCGSCRRGACNAMCGATSGWV
eukprot:366498-Chlamydomonas_euryale.AAC.7